MSSSLKLTNSLLKEERRANRLGENWASVRFEAYETLSPVKEGHQPPVGRLHLNNSTSIEVTVSEINRIMEELSDALIMVNRGRRLGIIRESSQSSIK